MMHIAILYFCVKSWVYGSIDNCALPSCSLLYRVWSGKVLLSHPFCSIIPLFSTRCPFSPSFILPPIFSCPFSRSPPISAVAFLFSCVLDVFPPLLSLLTFDNLLLYWGFVIIFNRIIFAIFFVYFSLTLIMHIVVLYF